MLRPQPGISCDLIFCPLVCGAVFHSCKADEHQLICPLVRIPCLNSGYGCAATIVRHQMYAHLEVCPAGVVCCTMEWNRWPISCLDYSSYESLSRGVVEVEQLDMALALQDQRTLLESLKVFAKAPTVEGAPLSSFRKGYRATDSAFLPSASEASTFSKSPSQSSSSCQPQPPQTDSAKEKIVSGINGLNEEHFSKLYEATVETARSLVAALEIVGSAKSVESIDYTDWQRDRSSSRNDLQNGLEDKTPEATEGFSKSVIEEQNVCSGCLRGNLSLNVTDHSILDTTNGPEAIENTVEMAHHVVVQADGNSGLPQQTFTELVESPVRMSQGVAQEEFVEDRGQGSLPNGQIGFIPDSSMSRLIPKMESKSVDTSDLVPDGDSLGVGEIDLISAALLFCLEESRECRRISDTVYVNGYRVDFGTQTFTFPAAILVTNTRVGDMASASACDHAAPQLSYPSPFHTLRLGLVLEAQEGETVPYNRYLPANPRYQHTFPFVCGQSFRRDQFSSHFTNVHGDIHAGLNGWMEHRCPLAYYGCTFTQRRFYPSTKGAKVVHDRHLRSFGVQLCSRVNLPIESQSDQFSGLPLEIVRHIAGFLDSFSLCQMSLVSRGMREVCSSLLQTRGIVDLQWERQQCSGTPGTVSWQIKNKVSIVNPL